MLIYSKINTNRLEYILNYIFSERLGLSYQLETDFEKFEQYSSSKINYSSTFCNRAFHIFPSNLLFERQINEEKPLSKNGFLYPQEKGDLRFDIFAASFWLLSRYEEYQNFTKDNHQRFSAKSSWAYQQKVIEIPIVDEWLIEFKNALKQYFPYVIFREEHFEVLPTIDVDSPWCYKNKGIVRNLGGFFRDLLKVDFKKIINRSKVLLSIKQDSHYQFVWLKNFYKQLNLTPIFFILVGKYSKYDKTTNPNSKAFKKFITEISEYGKIGIHLSYYVADCEKKIRKELQILENILQKKVSINRQHFLRFSLPNYYQNLIKYGIKEDYSMGFADHIGFRAGTSRSFLFYDLAKEKSTSLRIHPFSIMEVSLKNYQKKDRQQAFEKIKSIVKKVQQTEGKFVTLWHNDSLSDEWEWKNWKAIYERMLNLAIKR